MFESILFRRASQSQPDHDIGALAEAILFYDKTIIAADRGQLVHLLKAIGPDDLLGIIADKHISLSLVEDFFATYTTTVAGAIESHRFVAATLAGDKTKSKMSREEKLHKLVLPVLEDKSKTKKFVKKLLSEVPSIRINDFSSEGHVTDLATNDLNQEGYVQSVVKNVLELYAPEYSKKLNLEFKIVKLDDIFTITHNIDFNRVNSEQDNFVITPAFLINHLLDVRGEMQISAHYLSEVITTPLMSSLLKLQFQQLVGKRARSEEEISCFQDIFLDRNSVAEAISSGQRSFSDFRKLLDKSKKFKNWISDIHPDKRLIAEYQKSTVQETWAESLPVKSVRFCICTGLASYIGAAASPNLASALGIAVGLTDTFFLDKVIKGWKPHHFVDNTLKKFTMEK